MRFRQLKTARIVKTSDAEWARREHAEAITELQDALRRYVAGDNPGRWQFVHRETLRSASREISIGGLNGDLDEEYLIRGRLLCGGTGGTFSLRLNGQAGSRYARIYQSGGTAGAATSTAGLLIAPSAADELTTFEGVLYARSGGPRHYDGTGAEWPSTIEHWHVVGEWDDEEENITSIGVLHSASDIQSSSWVEVYRRAA